MEHADRPQPEIPYGMAMPKLALRFILVNEDVHTTIPGMRKRRHVESNLAVSDGQPLPEGLRNRLRAHRWDRVPTSWSQ